MEKGESIRKLEEIEGGGERGRREGEGEEQL